MYRLLIVHNVLNVHPTNHAQVFRASSLATWQPGLATSCQPGLPTFANFSIYTPGASRTAGEVCYLTLPCFWWCETARHLAAASSDVVIDASCPKAVMLSQTASHH